MWPAKVLNDSIALRISTDVTNLGIPTFLAIAPILAPFTPGYGLLYEDLVLAADNSQGLFRKATTVTPYPGLDPATGLTEIIVPEPVGGFSWQFDDSGGPVATVYGFALVAAVVPVLFATQSLDTPITLSDITQLLFFHDARLFMSQAWAF
jgi:hypothetical protein